MYQTKLIFKRFFCAHNNTKPKKLTHFKNFIVNFFFGVTVTGSLSYIYLLNEYGEINKSIANNLNKLQVLTNNIENKIKILKNQEENEKSK